MQNNYLSFDVILATKCGVKTAVVLNQIKLIIKINKSFSDKNKIIVKYDQLSSVLPFLKEIQLKGCIRKCYKFLKDNEVLSYLNCKSTEFKQILDSLSTKRI